MKALGPFPARCGSPVPAGVGFRVSVDPGTSRRGVGNMGWALWEGRLNSVTLIACGLGSPPLEGATKVVVELPQVYLRSPVPPNDLIVLAFAAGRIIGSAPPHCQVGTVSPHEWKGNLPKEVCNERVLSKLRPEELRVVEECGRFVPAGKMHNVLDGVGIGLAVWRTT